MLEESLVSYQPAVDERAVSAAQVFDNVVASFIEGDDAVLLGNERVIDVDTIT
jgi:hypothetical protein